MTDVTMEWGPELTRKPRSAPTARLPCLLDAQAFSHVARKHRARLALAGRLLQQL
jgi:hypothetical protein